MFIPLQAPNCYSDYMLCEMLAAHEVLLKKLRGELGGMKNRNEWLKSLINQHEEDTVQIGLLLEGDQPATD